MNCFTSNSQIIPHIAAKINDVGWVIVLKRTFSHFMSVGVKSAEYVSVTVKHRYDSDIIR